MRRLNRLTALCAGVLLLAAPAAFACELGEVASLCPMNGAMTDPMTEVPGSVGTSICHDKGQMSNECCDIQSAPEPTQALSIESARLLTALDVTDLQVVALPALATLPRHSTPADAFRLHDLGRYTLFSSFLL